MNSASLPAAGTRVGSYVLERECGQGGSSWVFQARHSVLGTRHALKMLLPTFAKSESLRARLIQEGRIQAALRHPNIINVTDVISTDDTLVLVMDFADGETLDSFLRTRPAEAADVWRDLFLPIVSAVGFAHERNIVHRDLKPSNIVIERIDGKLVPRVLDFGIAKALLDPDSDMTRTGTSLGTPRYMSPEQIQSAKGVDHRSDIFSLGAILYEISVGAPAFSGASDYEIMSRIVTGRFEPPVRAKPTLPPVRCAAIERALAVDMAKRFQSCTELGRALADGASTPAVNGVASAEPVLVAHAVPSAKCARCGREIAVDARFCAECGAFQTRMEAPPVGPTPRVPTSAGACDGCGAINDDAAAWCYRCGKKLAVRASTGHAPGDAVAAAAGPSQPAGFWIRAGARMLDIAILFVLEIPLWAIFGSPFADEINVPLTVIELLMSAAFCTYFVAAKQGTPGKLALGLRVVRLDGTSCTYPGALLRHVAEYLSALSLGLGYIWVALPEKRGWHDYIAGTKVVRKAKS